MRRVLRTELRLKVRCSSSAYRISHPERSKSFPMGSCGVFFLRERGRADPACCYWMSRFRV
jgi:hypothetical protein